MPDSSFTAAMYVDLKRCIGCNACSLACRQEFFGNVAPDLMPYNQLWTQVYGAEKESYPSVNVQVLPMRCQQCGDAPCKAKCDSLGYQAIQRRAKDGIVYIDENRCRGVACQKCIPVCPYKAMNMNPARTNPALKTKGVAEKCTFCMHRLDQGLAPACVITCLGVTLEFGEYNALRAKYPSAKPMNGGPKPRVLYDHLGGEPKRRTGGYPDAAPCHD